MDRIFKVASRVFTFVRRQRRQAMAFKVAFLLGRKVAKQGGKKADPEIQAQLDGALEGLNVIGQRTTAWMIGHLAFEVSYREGFGKLRWNPFLAQELMAQAPDGLLEDDVKDRVADLVLLMGEL